MMSKKRNSQNAHSIVNHLCAFPKTCVQRVFSQNAHIRETGLVRLTRAREALARLLAAMLLQGALEGINVKYSADKGQDLITLYPCRWTRI